MKSVATIKTAHLCWNVPATLGVFVFLFLGGTVALAQTHATAPPPMADSADQNTQLATQVAELRVTSLAIFGPAEA